MRIAILGTYRSGSSAIAGMLHHLGIELGSPFVGDHYESSELSTALRVWWTEPLLLPSMNVKKRRKFLRQWIEAREIGSNLVGAKHPLLSLSANDVFDAWGPETRFIWCARPLVESIDSLARLNWWAEPDRIQRKLNLANEEFFQTVEHLKLAYCTTQSDPMAQIELICNWLGLSPAKQQVDQALDWIQSWPKVKSRPSYTTSILVGAAEIVAVKEEAKPKIVATMLSGNSAPIVAEATQSVIGLVDEFCLIDTGISDDTINIVKAIAGSKFRKAEFPWCDDFSAARNAALDIAAKSGATWALTIDTDERLLFKEIVTRDELVYQLDSVPNVSAWMVAARDGSYTKERFFRIPSHGRRWHGRTHEALSLNPTHTRKLLDNCVFWECRKTPDQFRKKIERDLALLLDESAAHPLNPRWWYYLGQTYDCLKDYPQAVEAYDRCIRLDGWPEESAWACYKAARCLAALQEYRGAEEYCGLGMTRKPLSAEFPWMAGWCCYQRGSFGKAIIWSELAIHLGRDRNGMHAAFFRYLPAWYEAPYDVMRHSFERLNKPLAAEQAHKRYEAAKGERLANHLG